MNLKRTGLLACLVSGIIPLLAQTSNVGSVSVSVQDPTGGMFQEHI